MYIRKIIAVVGLVTATLGCAQAEEPRAPSEARTVGARSIFEKYLMKDLRFFESKFGAAETTRKDYWGQLRGLDAMHYTIEGCGYQIVADRGRVISIGIYVDGQQCDISVDPKIFGIDKASKIAVENLTQREIWSLAPRCPNSEGICARLDEFGEVIGEPGDTILLKTATAMMIPDISVEGYFRDDDGNVSLNSARSQNISSVILYRESHTLY